MQAVCLPCLTFLQAASSLSQAQLTMCSAFGIVYKDSSRMKEFHLVNCTKAVCSCDIEFFCFGMDHYSANR